MAWKRWTRNLGAKSLAFIASVALWLSATNDIEFEKTLTFPIEYVNLPEGITPVRELPTEARAIIRARGKFLAYRLRGGVCRVDLSLYQTGISTLVFDGANLVLPAKVAVAQREIIEPRQIAVEFDELVTREIAITAAVVGEPAARFVRLGRAAVSPSNAKVSGPRRFVDEIGLVSTEPINIDRDRSTVRKRVRLQAPGPPTVKVEPAMVEVGITIEPLVENELPDVVLNLVGTLPDSLQWEFRPASLRVHVSGARSIVEVAAAEVGSMALHADSTTVWAPGATVLGVSEMRGPEIVFTPAPVVSVPTAAGADSTPADAGGGEPGRVFGRLPLPGGVEIRSVQPERIVLLITPRREGTEREESAP